MIKNIIFINLTLHKMKRTITYSILSLSFLFMFACGNNSGNKDKSKGNESNSGSSCYSEYSKMHDLGKTIGNSYGEVADLVQDWRFDDETINEATTSLKEMISACDSALVYNPTCDKLKESKVLLDEIARGAKPLAEKVLKILEGKTGNDDIRYLKELIDANHELGKELGGKPLELLNMLNDSGANVIS